MHSLLVEIRKALGRSLQVQPFWDCNVLSTMVRIFVRIVPGVLTFDTKL